MVSVSIGSIALSFRADELAADATFEAMNHSPQHCALRACLAVTAAQMWRMAVNS
jgi:hypothetical protein